MVDGGTKLVGLVVGWWWLRMTAGCVANWVSKVRGVEKGKTNKYNSAGVAGRRGVVAMCLTASASSTSWLGQWWGSGGG